RVNRDVEAWVHRGGEIDEPVRCMTVRKRPPGYVVLLARVHRLGVVSFLLRRILREQAAAAVVLERSDDAPVPDRRDLVEGGGGYKRGEEEKAVHAFGLPRGEQSKPTHREATAGRPAPFLGSAESCCTASRGWTPAPRAAGRSLLRGSCERADLHSRGAGHEERVGGGGGSGSRGQHVVDQADPGPEDLPGRCERAADAALARCAVASYLLPRLTYTTEQRRYRQAEAFRGAVREQPRLIVPALAQPVRVERNGHQDVRLWHRAGFEQHG